MNGKGMGERGCGVMLNGVGIRGMMIFRWRQGMGMGGGGTSGDCIDMCIGMFGREMGRRVLSKDAKDNGGIA